MADGRRARIVADLALERVMFEAAEPEVFGWYVKTYGPDVNLFVDHSQVVQLECLRAGIWGRQDTWGRVHTYRPRRIQIAPQRVALPSPLVAARAFAARS